MFTRRFLVSLVMVLTLAKVARAELKVRSMRWVELHPTDAAPARTAFQAVISGASPGLRREEIVLRLQMGDPPTAMRASKLTPFSASQEDLAVFILVQGSVRFLGGEEGAGLLEEVKQAVNVIAQARKQHTRVGLYVYGTTVEAKAEMGPPEAVTGDLLGAPEEHAGVIDRAFQRGLEEAIRVLSAENGRRVLFVIGDGGDQREEYSVKQDLDRLVRASIEVYALGASIKEVAAADRRRMETLGRAGAFRYANQREQVEGIATFLVNEMNNVYTVEFPDLQPADGQVLPVDGEEHDAVLRAGVDEVDLEALKFPGPFDCVAGITTVKCLCKIPGKPTAVATMCEQPEPRPPVALYALIGGALLAAVGATIFVVRRRGAGGDEEEEMDAVPELVPVMALPVAAPPPVERRTQMMKPLDLDEGIPLVAWIVPVNGNMAYQTFRLADRTVIGAAPDCHVHIEDPHMSHHHAEILLRDGTFVLIDKDSRNGVQFVGKPVTRHPLVDNDLFTCGNTSFKFKTTGE